jgi:hypothetical protein
MGCTCNSGPDCRSRMAHNQAPAGVVFVYVGGACIRHLGRNALCAALRQQCRTGSLRSCGSCNYAVYTPGRGHICTNKKAKKVPYTHSSRHLQQPAYVAPASHRDPWHAVAAGRHCIHSTLKETMRHSSIKITRQTKLSWLWRCQRSVKWPVAPTFLWHL